MRCIIIEAFILFLQNIPTVLQYFLPGYWAILLFSFFNSKKIDGKMILILSCLISYLSITIISLFYIFDNVLILSGMSFLMLTILTIFISTLYSAKWFKKVLIKLFHKTPNDDIWRDVLDLEQGSNLKVYFKEKDYCLIGHHKVHEEKGEDSWYAISAFIKVNPKTDEIIEDRYKDNENIIMTFRLSDVEHIEIF